MQTNLYHLHNTEELFAILLNRNPSVYREVSHILLVLTDAYLQFLLNMW